MVESLSKNSLFIYCDVKLDIFPPGTILGITNGFGTIPGWLAPLMAASFTDDQVLFSIVESKQDCSKLGLQFQIEKNPASSLDGVNWHGTGCSV